MMQDLFKNISLRETRMLLLGLGAIVSAAILVTLIVPNAKSFYAANGEVRMLQKIAQDGDSLPLQLTRQASTNEELQRRLLGDTANLPERQVEAYIIGRLQRVSWNNDIELVSVEPATGERLQVFQEMLFNVRLAGQYDDLYQWLLEARGELGFVVVKEYALKRQDAVDQTPRLLAELSLASYRAVE